MKVGDNIKALRKEKNMTQKDLADQLCVTYQAVSNWENNNSEPSIDTLRKMADIFSVSVDELLNGKTLADQTQPAVQENVTSIVVNEGAKEDAAVQPVKEEKPVVAVCDTCHKALREGDDFLTIPGSRYHGSTYRCRECEKKRKQAEANMKFFSGIHVRNLTFIWSSIITAVVFALFIALLVAMRGTQDYNIIIGVSVYSMISIFPMCYTLGVNNNDVSELFETIASWSIHFPGLIFSFDLDGFMWLIGMKILFAVLGFFIGVATFLLAVVVTSVVSLFVFPYAIVHSFRHPEDNDGLF